MLLLPCSTHSPYTHLLTQVQVEFTKALYLVSEDEGYAAVAVTISQGDADRDRPIIVTVITADDTAIGKL